MSAIRRSKHFFPAMAEFQSNVLFKLLNLVPNGRKEEGGRKKEEGRRRKVGVWYKGGEICLFNDMEYLTTPLNSQDLTTSGV